VKTSGSPVSLAPLARASRDTCRTVGTTSTALIARRRPDGINVTLMPSRIQPGKTVT